MAGSDDGGPAFPFVTGGFAGGSPGMSLRDWFAGQAIAGKCGLQAEKWVATETLVKFAYAIADAMIAERKRRGG